MAFQGLSSLPDDPLGALPNDPAPPPAKGKGLESLPDDPLSALSDDPAGAPVQEKVQVSPPGTAMVPTAGIPRNAALGGGSKPQTPPNALQGAIDQVRAEKQAQVDRLVAQGMPREQAETYEVGTASGVSPERWKEVQAEDEARKKSPSLRAFEGFAHGTATPIVNLASVPSGLVRETGRLVAEAPGLEDAGKRIEQAGDALRPTEAKKVLEQTAPKTEAGQAAQFIGHVFGMVPTLGILGPKGFAVQSAGNTMNDALDKGAGAGKALLAGSAQAAKDLILLKASSMIPALQTTNPGVGVLVNSMGTNAGMSLALTYVGNLIDKLTWDPQRGVFDGTRDALAMGLAFGLLHAPQQMRAAEYRRMASEHPNGVEGFMADLQAKMDKLSKVEGEMENTITLDAQGNKVENFDRSAFDKVSGSITEALRVARQYRDSLLKAGKLKEAMGTGQMNTPAPAPEAPPQSPAGAMPSGTTPEVPLAQAPVPPISIPAGPQGPVAEVGRGPVQEPDVQAGAPPAPVAGSAPGGTGGGQPSREVAALAEQVQQLGVLSQQMNARAQQHPHVEEALGDAAEAADLLQAAKDRLEYVAPGYAAAAPMEPPQAPQQVAPDSIPTQSENREGIAAPGEPSTFNLSNPDVGPSFHLESEQELRAAVNKRVEELMASGMTRDEAVNQGIKERLGHATQMLQSLKSGDITVDGEGYHYKVMGKKKLSLTAVDENGNPIDGGTYFLYQPDGTPDMETVRFLLDRKIKRAPEPSNPVQPAPLTPSANLPDTPEGAPDVPATPAGHDLRDVPGSGGGGTPEAGGGLSGLPAEGGPADLPGPSTGETPAPRNPTQRGPALPDRLAPIPGPETRLLHGSPIKGLTNLSPSKGKRDAHNAQFGTGSYAALGTTLPAKFMVDRGPMRQDSKPGSIYSFTSNIKTPFDFTKEAHYTPEEGMKLGIEGLTGKVDGLTMRALLMDMTGNPEAFARYMKANGYDSGYLDYTGKGDMTYVAYNEGHASDLREHASAEEAQAHLDEHAKKGQTKEEPPAPKVVKAGETFTHKGREYRMAVTDGQVKTRDLSIKGGPPIVRSWGTVAEFEKETGIKVDTGEAKAEPKPAATSNTRPAILKGARALAERMGKKLNREVKPSEGLLNMAQPRLLASETKPRKGTLIGGLVDGNVERDDSHLPLNKQIKAKLEALTGAPITQNYVDSLERAVRDFEYNDTLDPANKHSRSVFTSLTGRILPQTIKGTKEVLERLKEKKSAETVEKGGRDFTVGGEDVSIPEDRTDLIKRFDKAKAELDSRQAEIARVPNKAIRAKMHHKAGAEFAKVKSALKDALIADTEEKPDTSKRGTDGLPAQPDPVDEGQPAGTTGNPAAGEPAGPVAPGEDPASGGLLAKPGGKGSRRLGVSGAPERGLPASGSPGTGPEVQPGREADASGLGAGSGDLPSAGNYDIASGGLNTENLNTDHGKRKGARANLDALKLLKKLEKAGRLATADEQKVLAKYVGWGGIDKAVDTWRARQAEKPEGEKDNAQKKWEKVWGPLHKELASLLTPEEMDTARTSILNAHYTSQEVIEGIWKGLEQLGFKGGKALEPSAGIGNFIGLLPADLRGTTSWMGVELDRTTAGILKHLYQDAQIFNSGFQEVKFDGEPFDLAISNFPFSDKIKFRYEGKSHPIHDYFFLKSLDAVKPGGLVVGITSHYTMDKVDSGIRQKISEMANFIGAIRLPHTAFEGNAGTSVVTDIIFLQKKGGATPAEPANWTGVKPVTVTTRTGETANPNVNQYFHEHPEMVLGEWGAGGLQREDQLNVVPKDGAGSLLEQIQAAAKHLPQGVAPIGEPGKVEATVEPTRAQPVVTAEGAPGSLRDGSLVAQDGDLRILENGGLVHPDFLAEYETRVVKDAFGKPVLTRAGKPRKERVLTGHRKATAEELETAQTYTELKQTLNDLLQEEERVDADEDRMAELRQELNYLYDKLIEPRAWKKGVVRPTPLIEKPLKGERHPLAWLKEDIDYPMLASIEKPGNPEKGILTEKGPIFTQRVMMPRQEPAAGSMDELAQAVGASMVWRGVVDTAYISVLSGRPLQEVEQALPRERQAFIDPATQVWESGPAYLSGNVREKLAKAKAAGQGFEENVAALEAVQPLPKVFEQVAFDMTTPWVPSELVERGMSEVAGVAVSTRYLKQAGAWSVEIQGTTNAEVKSRYAGEGFDAEDLVKDSIAGRSTTVADPVWDSAARKTIYVTNPVKTAAAQIAQRQLEADYQTWAQSQAKAYEDAYNERVNHSVSPEYAVPAFDHYPEANRTIRLEKYQKRGNERGLAENTLLAHAVGTGKTFTEITNAVEAKRRGFAQKPMIVVQNATALQFAAASRFLYPNKRVLSLDADPSPGSRRRFLAQLKTSNFDLAIIPMSVFNMIPDNPARIASYIREQKRLLEDELRGMSSSDKKAAERTQKQAQNALDKLSDKLMQQAARATDGFTPWDSLGIDWLIIDESHNYKKLGFFTQRNRIKGIDDSRSKRAMSLFIKAQAVREKQGGKNRGLIFATGTPVANTMAELWTIGRFLNPELNERFGLTSFDGFVGNFGRVVSNFEYSPTGQYKYVPSLSKFKNAHEFQTYFLSFADRVGKEQVERQVLPELVGGDRTIFHVEPSETTARIIEGLAARLRAWYNLSGAEKKEKSAEPLVVEGLATAAAIDPRLVDPTISFDPDTKLMEAVKWAHNLWETGKAEKTATVLFLDRYRSPDPDSNEGAHLAGIPRFNAHHEIRDRLIEMGVPAKEIFLFTEASKAQTEVAMDAANRGDIRILVATSEKGGVGLNFQIKLKNLGHIDLPMRPCDLEQREGRQIRAGNEFPLVNQAVFGTKRSLDTLKAQRLFRKQGFINQFLYGKLGQTEDEFSDIGSGEALSYNDMVGQFSGDPRVIRKAELEKELQGVQNQRAAFYSGIANAKTQIRSLENQLESGEKNIESIVEELKAIDGLPEIVAKEGLFNDYRAATKAGEAFYDRLKAEWAEQGGGFDGKKATAFGVKYGEDWKRYPSPSLDLGGGYNLGGEFMVRGKLWGPEGVFSYKITKGGKTLFEGETKQTVGQNVKNAVLHHLAEVPASLVRARLSFENNTQSLKGYQAKLGGTWAQEDHMASLQAELDALKAELEAEGLHAKDGDQIPEGVTEDADVVAEVEEGEDASQVSKDEDEGPREMQAMGHPLGVFLSNLFGSRTRPDSISIPSAFADVEARWRAAKKGATGTPMFARAIENLRKAKAAFTQHFDHIDPNESPLMAQVNDILRQYEAGPAFAKAVAHDMVHEVTKGLGPKRIDLFTRVLVLRDIVRNVERETDSADEELPFGYANVKEARYDLERFEDVLNEPENEPIREALKKRNDQAKAIVETLVNHGILNPDTLHDVESYYHRQVMTYLNGRTPAASGSDVRMKRKGFQIARKGGANDFNVAYEQAEAEWVADAMSLVVKKETLDQLQKVADIGPRLRAQANQINLETFANKNPSMSQKDLDQMKPREIAKALGDDAVDWQSLAPEGYAIWQPNKGNHFYPALTLSEKLLDQFLEGDAELSKDDFTRVLAVGAKKKQWAIPQNLATQLDHFVDRDSSEFGRFWVGLQSSWKQWQLISPFRIGRYSLNNMMGDLDIAVAYDPRIVSRHFGQAASDMWSYQVGHSANPVLVAEIQDAIRRGVVESGITIAEIPDIDKTGAFRLLTSDRPNGNLVQKLWGGLKTFSTWRENILRLAAYRFFQEELAKGRNLYAASNRDQVDALSDRKAKAAKLARELIGDYGNVSVAGQYIRTHMIPFYSWMEVNAPRYVRLLKNLPHEGEPKPGQGSQRTRIGVAGRTLGVKAPGLALRMAVVFGLIYLFNQLFFKDEYEDLRRQKGFRNGLILGRREDGTIRYVRMDLAIIDALDWLSLGDLPQKIGDIRKGKESWSDLAADAAKGPAEKIIKGWEPFSKTLFELVLGRSISYPSVWREGASLKPGGMAIRDKMGYVLKNVTPLDRLYNKVTHKPQRQTDAGNAAVDALLAYSVDPGEASYFLSRDIANDWMKKNLKREEFSGSGAITEKGNALYYFKRASQWGDKDNAAYWLNQFYELGGRPKDIQGSIKRGHPLGSVPPGRRGQFMSSLNEADRKVIADAITWYQRLNPETRSIMSGSAMAPKGTGTEAGKK